MERITELEDFFLRYKDFLRHRQAWMGIAMMLIILFHIPTTLEVPVLHQLQMLGYCGVDIFFFASGIGCYFSLRKDEDAGRFMLRRLRKLGPTYLVFIVFWLLAQMVCGNANFQMAVGNLFAIQSFTGLGQDLNWYVSAIFLFYLLTPYFKQIADRASTRNKVLFLLALIAVSIPFWHSGNMLLTMTRLPIYYLGVLFATLCREDRKIAKPTYLAMVVSIATGAAMLAVFFLCFPEQLWTMGLYWYPFILLTAPMCMILSSLMALLEKSKITKPIADGVSLVGKYSFEVCLIHVPLIALIDWCIHNLGLEKWQLLLWLGGLVVLVAGCFLLRKLTALCVKFFEK